MVAADISLPVVFQSHRVKFACGDHGEVLSKVGGDKVVAVHGDGCRGSVDIGDGSHIASPVGKAVAIVGGSHQVDHCSLVIDKYSLSRFGHLAAFGAGDDEDVFLYFLLREEDSG